MLASMAPAQTDLTQEHESQREDRAEFHAAWCMGVLDADIQQYQRSLASEVAATKTLSGDQRQKAEDQALATRWAITYVQDMQNRYQFLGVPRKDALSAAQLARARREGKAAVHIMLEESNRCGPKCAPFAKAEDSKKLAACIEGCGNRSLERSIDACLNGF
jgi:hypothetical protein